jgi:hypothetical protein
MTTMTLRSTLSLLALACTSLVVGCSANADDGGSASKDVTLSGNVGGSGGSGSGTTTKSFGGLTSATSALHVVAHEVHLRGVTGRTVDVAVAADGSFHVGVERGKRWLVTVDDAAGHSAIVTFGGGESVLRVGADGTSSRVDLGDLSVIGGEAASEIALDASLGIEATLAGLDDVFEAADGAIIAARAAAEDARKAAEDARKAAGDAQAQAEAARRAAEQAAHNAGL